ncbi:MAG: hypothetical protein MUF83_10685 [Acidimicrobiales bacterium]|nr:hypothetical protein [Acidimicrobiales bacterium]
MSVTHTHHPLDLSRLPDKHLSVATAAVDVADAIEALGVEGLPADAQAHLSAIIERQKRAGLGVPVSSAAAMLDVTPRTVRKWIDGGILELVAGSTPKKVTVLSLGAALAAVHRIRAAGQDRNLFKLVLDELDDRRTRRELADRIDALERRAWTAVSDADLDDLLG